MDNDKLGRKLLGDGELENVTGGARNVPTGYTDDDDEDDIILKSAAPGQIF